MKPFHQVTTCHGVADFYRAPCMKTRTFWMVNILVGFSLLTYFVFIVVDDYTKAALMTSMSMIGNPQMILPEISICYNLPFNPLKAEAIGMPVDVVSKLLMHYQVATRIGQGLKDHPILAAQLENFLTDPAFGGNLDLFLKNVSFTCTDFLLAAYGGIFNMTTQLCDEVRYIDHPQTGYCMVVPTIVQVWPGSSAGWKLLLGIPNYPEEYKLIQYAEGFSVAFDNPLVIPMFNNYLVPPGRFTSVLISATYVQKVQYLAWPKVSKKMCETDRFDGDSACYLKCWANATLTECGCTDFGFQQLLPNVTRCNPFGPACHGTSFLPCQANCLPVCRQWEYTASVTTAPLNEDAMIHDFGGTKKNMAVVALSVAYSDMKYKTVDQKEAFTLQTTVSSVGGQLGLWMGISVITVLQAFYYAIGVICRKSKAAHVKNLKNSKSKKLFSVKY